MKAELYILGILHRGDFHPYEIRRRLTQAMIECFTDVDVGTLYYAVRQLAEGGLLTAVAHQRVARGGMRFCRCHSLFRAIGASPCVTSP